MSNFFKSLIAPFLIGVFIISFNQNTANNSDSYFSNLPEENSSSLFTDEPITPYSEIPCDHIYKTWDNTNIHPYQFQRSRMRDTVELVMGFHSCDFHMPREGNITSNFGKRDGGYHYGIDIKLRTGSAVTAAFEGMVRIAKYSSSYGNVVVIRHNNGIETLYAHLSKRKVKPGDFVQAGEVIGLGGNTGRSSGSHLHFETRYKGEPINPNKIIDFKNNELRNDTIFLTKHNFKSSKNILKNRIVKKKAVVKKKAEAKKPKPTKKTQPKADNNLAAVNPLLKKTTPVKKKKTSNTKTTYGKKYHKVKKGNTVYSLARENGVSVSQIQTWNKLVNNNIKVGSKIRVK